MILGFEKVHEQVINSMCIAARHSEKLLIISAKEVMFSLCLFVCLLAGLCKNYSADFHKIRWKGGTWATEETVRFWW